MVFNNDYRLAASHNVFIKSSIVLIVHNGYSFGLSFTLFLDSADRGFFFSLWSFSFNV